VPEARKYYRLSLRRLLIWKPQLKFYWFAVMAMLIHIMNSAIRAIRPNTFCPTPAPPPAKASSIPIRSRHIKAEGLAVPVIVPLMSLLPAILAGTTISSRRKNATELILAAAPDCTAFGYTSGTLHCTWDCRLDLSNCIVVGVPFPTPGSTPTTGGGGGGSSGSSVGFFPGTKTPPQQTPGRN